jgi:prepilin signal peptidase PulO-like enzyme (type II secretory pathway)
MLVSAASFIVSAAFFARIAHWRGARLAGLYTLAIGVFFVGLLVSMSRDAGWADGVAVGICVAALAVCSWTDAQLGLAFDHVTLGGLTAVLCLRAVGGVEVPAVLGCVCASGALMLLHVATRGRGVGLGDVKLAALIGALLGVVDGAVALGVAFVAGSVIGVSMMLVGRADRKSEFRFAPYLAAGAGAAYVLWGSA